MNNGQLAKAIHYTDTWPPLNEGDQVLLNTTAVDLSLGSGGFHFVHSILSNGISKQQEQPDRTSGHLMKLRYTPLQRAVFAVEEQASPYHKIFTEEHRHLQGMPVLIGELHSMLPIAMCWIQDRMQKQLRVVYIMSDGGAIPLTFSHHVAALQELGWLAGTVTYGHAYGGDFEAINKYSALITAKHVLQADVAIVLMGPGIAGTGSVFGHTGVEVGELVNAVSVLQGIPIVIPRISFTDSRERHVGLSHHTIHSLKTIALKPSILPLPAELPQHQKVFIQQQIEQHQLHKHAMIWVPSIEHERIVRCLSQYPYEIKTMGKNLSEDPAYFQGVCAAAQTAMDVYMGAMLM